jgi:hypothetical protein
MKSQCVFIKIIICTYTVLFIPEWGIGQSVVLENDTKADEQLWIDIYPHFYVSEKFEYFGDAGYRTVLNQNSWHWIYARPSLRYHLGKNWEVHGGIGFFYVIKKEVSDRFEIRPWQGIEFSWPRFSNLGFKHYIRFEQRISFQTDDWSSGLSLRLRYKISGKNDFGLFLFMGNCFFRLATRSKSFSEIADGLELAWDIIPRISGAFLSILPGKHPEQV